MSRYDTPRERVLEAMISVVDCDAEDNDAYRRAWERFRSAAIYWLATTAGARARVDMAGERVGLWTVVDEAPSRIGENGKPRTMWLCRCECGNTGVVSGDQLRRGKSRGCRACRSKGRMAPRWDRGRE